MKKIKRIIFLFIVLIFIGGYLFLRFRLNSFLASELSRALNRPVIIGKTDLAFPFSISLRNLVIYELPLGEDKKFMEIDKIKITPSLIPLLKGKVILYSVFIEHPQLKIVRLTRDKFNFSDITDSQKVKSEKVKSEKKSIPFSVLKFKINNGELIFVDKSLGETDFTIFLRDIDFSINKLIFPLTDIATEFILRAKLVRENIENPAEINSSGWLNFTRKDMDAKFSLKNLDYLEVKPYLKEAISGKISQGIINLYADINSQANNLKSKCKIELEKIVAEDTSSKIFGIPLDKIIEAFKDKEGKISFAFEIETKFDQPSINYAKIGESLFKQITEKLMSKTPSLILEKVTGDAKEGAEKIIKEPLEAIKEILGEPSTE